MFLLEPYEKNRIEEAADELNDSGSYLEKAEMMKHSQAIIKDDDEYVNDTLIIPTYLAKGLKFDVVLIFHAGDENYSCEEERLFFCIS